MAGIKDLAGKTCGVQAGSAMLASLPEEEMLKPGGGKMGEVVQHVSYPGAYQDLAIGRTDYVANTQINLRSLVNDKPGVFEMGQAVSRKIHIAWGGEEGQHRGPGHAGRLPAGAAQERREMAKLQQKWFGVSFDMPEHWTAA